MKTCISTYSFAPLIWNKQLTYFDVLDKIKEFGADGVEFVMAEEVPHNGNPAEFTLRFAEAARKKGLDIPIYTTSANFLCRDVEERSGGWKKYRYCGRGGDPAHAPRYCRGLFMKDTKGCPLSRPSFPLWRLLFARWRITPRKGSHYLLRKSWTSVPGQRSDASLIYRGKPPGIPLSLRYRKLRRGWMSAAPPLFPSCSPWCAMYMPRIPLCVRVWP